MAVDKFVSPSVSKIQLPGVVKGQQRHPMLEKNHKEHHMFFNKAGFHNHMVHQYLSAYALGATPERLQEIFDAHASFQRPLPPHSKVVELTRDNYREHLGNRDWYPSYLEFFKKEIDELGVEKAVQYWIFKDDMLPRFVGAAIHPLIHMGYAAEFDIPYVAAEALASTACAQGYLAPMMVEESNSNTDAVEHTLLDLVEKIRKDPDLDGVAKYSDEVKLMNVVHSNTAVQKIREAVTLWNVNERNLEAKMKDLFVSIMLLYAGSGVRNNRYKLDFFLAHALTSTHAVFNTVQQYLDRSQAAKLMRAHVATALVWYLARGKPSVDVEALTHYQSPSVSTNEHNPWLQVLDRALGYHEAHVIKVVRATAVGQMMYGDQYPNVWLKAAQMTLDHAGGDSSRGNWEFEGVGFDETWTRRDGKM